MKIQILGTGCPKCRELAEKAEAAARESGIDYDLEKITEIDRIMAMGVMLTPALAIDGTVKIMGRVPPVEEIRKLLQATI